MLQNYHSTSQARNQEKMRNFWLIQGAFFDTLLRMRGKFPHLVRFLYEPEICLSQIPFFEENS